MWHRGREEANAVGCSSHAVGLIKFVNDSNQSVTMPIQIAKGAMLAMQHAEPFKFLSTIGHIREVPMNDLTCLEWVLLYLIPQHILTSRFKVYQLSYSIRFKKLTWTAYDYEGS